MVDFRLAFIVLIADVYGLNAGVAAAFLASLSLAAGYWAEGASPLLLFYEPSNWLAFLVYFVVGAVCGYVQLRSAEDLRFAEEEQKLLKSGCGSCGSCIRIHWRTSARSGGRSWAGETASARCMP